MTFLLLFLFGLFALGAVPVQAEGDDERRCAIYLSADVPHWGTCLFAEDCVASDLMYSNDAQQCWGTGRTCCMPKITCDHNNDGFAVRRVRALAAARTPGRPHTKSSLFHLLLIFVLAFFCFTFVPTALSCNAISGLFDATMRHVLAAPPSAAGRRHLPAHRSLPRRLWKNAPKSDQRAAVCALQVSGAVRHCLLRAKVPGDGGRARRSVPHRLFLILTETHLRAFSIRSISDQMD